MTARRRRGGAPAFVHVVFDLDGTLVDTAVDLAAATNHVLRHFGLPELEAAALRAYVGDGARTLVSRALGPRQEARVEEGVACFLAYYGRHLLDATRPYAGIDALLPALHAQGIRLSVVTNKACDLSRAILDGLGLLRWLDGVVGGDSLPTRKPDPAGLEHVLAASGTTKARALMVGDSPIDRDTARAARVAFCGVRWGFASRLLEEGAPPSLLVGDVAALRALVERGIAGVGARSA